MTEFGDLQADRRFRRSAAEALLPPSKLTWDQHARLGEVIYQCLPTQSSKWHWGHDGNALGDDRIPRIMCHDPVKNHKIKYSVFDGSILYMLCDFSLHVSTVAAHCVTPFKQWQEESRNRKGRWNMKAPKPKLVEFGKLEAWEELCGGIDRPVKAKITAEPEQGEYGWNVPFRVGEHELVQTVKEDSANYREMFDGLGDDFADWVGKSVKVSVFVLEKGKYKGNKALRIKC